MRILWYTKSKKIDEAQVPIESIKDLTIGQISQTFIKYPLKILEDFSFSIYYQNKNENELKTLDLTCKDQKEFDLWAAKMKEIFKNKKCQIITKIITNA